MKTIVDLLLLSFSNNLQKMLIFSFFEKLLHSQCLVLQVKCNFCDFLMVDEEKKKKLRRILGAEERVERVGESPLRHQSMRSLQSKSQLPFGDALRCIMFISHFLSVIEERGWRGVEGSKLQRGDMEAEQRE